MQMSGRAFEERGLVSIGPYFLRARAAIEAAAMGKGISGNQSPIQAPRQDAGEHAPCIVGLPTPGAGGDLVAPGHEYTARAAVSQRRKREVAEVLLDARDQRDVAPARAVGEGAEILAGLIALQHGEDDAMRRCGFGRDRRVVAG